MNHKGIAIRPDHIKAMEKWPVPTSKKGLQQFLGFANYFRGHIPHYADIAAPLYKLILPGADMSISLSEEHLKIIEDIKKKLTSAPVLAYPDMSQTFILDVDASNVAIGGCLSQYIDGKEQAITYASLSLTAAQKNYCATRKELLSVIMFTRHFRHYLLGKKFICRTDHNSLTWLMGFKNIEGQLSRWIEELSQYDMVLIHRPGKDHINADFLSRITEQDMCNNYNGNVKPRDLPCAPCNYCDRMHKDWERFLEEIDYVVPLSIRSLGVSEELSSQQVTNWLPNYTAEDLRRLQIEDVDLQKVIEWLETDFVPDQGAISMGGPVVKHLWRLRKQLFFKNSVLFYKWEDALFSRNLLVVPRVLRNEVIQFCHDDILAGHRGRDNTRAAIKNSFFWSSMAHDVKVFVQTCHKCNKNKSANKTFKAPMVLYQAGYPMHRNHIDIIGPFTKSHNGNVYILMIVDQFTRWLECFPLSDQTAHTVADKAVRDVYSRLGFPEILHSDQGPCFTSALFTQMCKLLQIAKSRTLPYRPASNGQCERYNRVVLDMIRCLSSDLKSWDEYLPFISSAIRSMVNGTSGFSPNYMMLGRETSRPIEILYGVERQSFSSEIEYVRHLDEVMRKAHFLARKHIQGEMCASKRAYDRTSLENNYEKGDFVYKVREGGKKGLSKKLLSLYEGPYVVTGTIPPVLVCIQGRKRSSYVHHNKLKPCDDRHIPLWLRRKRQEILNLDDTLPYDVAEQSDSEEGLGELFEITQPAGADSESDGPDDMGAEYSEGMTLPTDSEPLSESQEVPATLPERVKKHVYAKQAQKRDLAGEAAVPSTSTSGQLEPARTRGGRQIKRPQYLSEYSSD